jgi:hypothetical protein
MKLPQWVRSGMLNNLIDNLEQKELWPKDSKVEIKVNYWTVHTS